MDKEIDIGPFKFFIINFMCQFRRMLLEEINIQIGEL